MNNWLKRPSQFPLYSNKHIHLIKNNLIQNLPQNQNCTNKNEYLIKTIFNSINIYT
ncbi:hypothetical protein HanXRQr2_Chr10g0434601 [Helianthus annuus]|uniref:Uncharacterized protein n=1 Tax=Helianthus annuus TaxID=4232 RepID=A0A9K3N400_HELAN|nr:hypothetical protein HanXRQr2_Chr10g0434601 [Helianthus annuus]KAJ0883299.1 hypothetical protein HanPSC8_Chr10g0419881 [Helianthus annuus]